MDKENIIQIALITLGTICILISTVQTYYGYYEAVNKMFFMAIGLTLLISIGLAIFNYMIYQDVAHGTGDKKHIYLIFYLAFAIFSFAANINAFYSQYMKREIINNGLSNLKSDMSRLEKDITVAIDKSRGVDSLILDVENLRDALVKQVNDRVVPGVGVRAKLLITELEDKLATKLTIPYGEPSQQAAGLSQLIDDLLQNIVNVKMNTFNDLQEESSISLTTLISEIDSVRLTNKLNDDEQLKVRIIEKYNTLSEKAEAIINNKKLFRSKRIKDEDQELGSIKHTFTSMRKKEYQNASIIAIMLSLLIDLITPAAIIAVHLPMNRRKQGRFPNRRKKKEDIIK